MLSRVLRALRPTQTVVLRGNTEALRAWRARCTQHYAPRRLTLAIPDQAKELPGILAQRVGKGSVTAYICSGHACETPVTEFARLDVVLAATASPKA